MAKVCLLVMFASAVSSRHLFDDNRFPQPLNSGLNGSFNDQFIQRRNIEYNSGLNTLHQYKHKQEEVYPQHHHSVDNNQNQIINKFDFPVGNQAGSNEKKHSGDRNNNEFNLRTSSYPPENKRPDSHIESAFTNLNSKMGNALPDRINTETERTNVIIPSEYEGTLKTNANINRTAEDSVRMDGEVKTSRPMKDKVNVNQVSTPSRGQVPKEDKTEEMWIWGTPSTTTTADDLDDRSAFVGDRCPTGYAKINGKCIEKH